MTTTKTHWKTAFKSDYLSSLDVPEGKDLVLTIKEVKLQGVKNQKGTSECNVIHFEENAKPMVLNVTNSKMVRKFANNSNYIEEWAGVKIQIYVKSNVKFGNDTVDALRIRDAKPKTSTPQPIEALESLRWCKNLDELQAAYMLLSAQDKKHPSIVLMKTEMKDVFTARQSESE